MHLVVDVTATANDWNVYLVVDVNDANYSSEDVIPMSQAVALGMTFSLELASLASTTRCSFKWLVVALESQAAAGYSPTTPSVMVVLSTKVDTCSLQCSVVGGIDECHLQ